MNKCETGTSGGLRVAMFRIGNITKSTLFNKALFHCSLVFYQKGVIRVSGIPLEYSESELIKMASPFGPSVEVLMATEIDTTTCLEWKQVCHFRMYMLHLFILKP